MEFPVGQGVPHFSFASPQEKPHLNSRADGIVGVGAGGGGGGGGDALGAYVVGTIGAVQGRLVGPAGGGTVGSAKKPSLVIEISAQFQNCVSLRGIKERE